MDFVYITSFDLWKILEVKAFFAAILGKTGYEKRKVNEPGYLPFNIQSCEIPKKKKKNSCWSCLQIE